MKTMIEKTNWDKIDEIDTGARARVERWRDAVKLKLANVPFSELGEITALADLHNMTIIDWVIAYLKKTRLDCTDERIGFNCPRLNRTNDILFDNGSRQARAHHETETVALAFSRLGVRAGETLTHEELRELAKRFATPDDWNLNDAKTRAVRFALDHMDN